MGELLEITVVQIDDIKSDKCPDYDCECKDVISPSQCWTGDWGVGPADGYCPLMFKGKLNG